jgi:hypothetical protein
MQSLGREQFLALQVDLSRALAGGDAELFAVLEAHGIPQLTEDLRRRERGCRATPYMLPGVNAVHSPISDHSHANRFSQLCVCPSLRVLLLCRTVVYATRTHGHHFHEEARTTYSPLTWAEFAAMFREHCSSAPPRSSAT